MKRRNFFKTIVAAITGVFAMNTQVAAAPQTTLRFNENRIEAWNGEEWLSMVEFTPEQPGDKPKTAFFKNPNCKFPKEAAAIAEMMKGF